MKELVLWDEKLCRGIFEAADFEFAVKFLKNKMADPKWLTIFQNPAKMLIKVSF